MFNALVVDKDSDGAVAAGITEIDDSQLPEGDTTIAVEYSTINYKDGLAIANRSPIIRNFPMVPGIDLSGTVSAGGGGDCGVGTRVILSFLPSNNSLVETNRSAGILPAAGFAMLGVPEAGLPERTNQP